MHLWSGEKYALLVRRKTHLPSRISLCDAFYSNGIKSYLTAPHNTTAKAATASTAAIKRRGVLFEAFEAPLASVSPYDLISGSARRALQPVVHFYSIIDPVGLGALQVAAWNLYFSCFGLELAVVPTRFRREGKKGPIQELGPYPLIASASDDELWECVEEGMCVCWRQQPDASRFE
jgi:hypothetical protein